MDDATGTVLPFEFGIFRVVIGFGFFLGVEVVEIAEELVEAVHGGQVLVAITEMVFAELAGGVALLFKEVGDGGRPVRDAVRGAGHPNSEQAGAEWMLTKDERGATRGAALLGVGISEECALFGDAVDVGCSVSHYAVVVCADVVNADVIAPN